jgi:hypothetical protein
MIGGAFGTNGKGEKFLQCSGKKTWWKGTTW